MNSTSNDNTTGGKTSYAGNNNVGGQGSQTIPQKMSSLGSTIERNIGRISNDEQVLYSIIEARTALDLFIKLARISNTRKRTSNYVASARLYKIRKWSGLLDYYQSRRK